MSDVPEAVLSSGFIEITPEAVEALPEGPGHYRIRSPGQRIMFVGHSGSEGLRTAVREIVSGSPIAGYATVEYEVADSDERAARAAEADIGAFKPLYNEGFGRYRPSETHLPKKGHRVRPAMHNP